MIMFELLYIIMVNHIVQWNYKLPDFTCIQETWLELHVDFVISGYNDVIEKNKQGVGVQNVLKKDCR